MTSAYEDHLKKTPFTNWNNNQGPRSEFLLVGLVASRVCRGALLLGSCESMTLELRGALGDYFSTTL